ncbi:MAG: hypothetical protein COB25_006640 [Oceanospirillales bacterium]|nr:hypothetical protein [Oceanospirillales bacterium]
MNKTIFLIAGALLVLGVGGAYASGLFGVQAPVGFYKGHTHGPSMEAIGAPAHSGGTDAEGCHNASVPRHCH